MRKIFLQLLRVVFYNIVRLKTNSARGLYFYTVKCQDKEGQIPKYKGVAGKVHLPNTLKILSLPQNTQFFYLAI
jgi:hypothetical protein